MNGLINSVSLQIQKAISEAFNEQVLPPIQASLRSGSGKMPQKGWNVGIERPEYRTGGFFNRKVRSSSRDEFPRNPVFDDDEEESHYTMLILCMGSPTWLFLHLIPEHLKVGKTLANV